jgi:sRNA-binding protein
VVLEESGRDAGQGAREQAKKAAAQVHEAKRRLAAAEQRQRAWNAGARARVPPDATAPGWALIRLAPTRMVAANIRAV